VGTESLDAVSSGTAEQVFEQPVKELPFQAKDTARVYRGAVDKHIEIYRIVHFPDHGQRIAVQSGYPPASELLDSKRLFPLPSGYSMQMPA
jgi:hypothetical protein